MLKLTLQYFGHLMQTAGSSEKTPMLGNTEGRRRRGDRECDGWTASRLNGREFEQTQGDSEGQGSLACCSLWGLKESDTTEQLNDNKGLRINDSMIWKGNTWAFFPEDCCLCRVLSWEAWHAVVHGVSKSQT